MTHSIDRAVKPQHKQTWVNEQLPIILAALQTKTDVDTFADSVDLGETAHNVLSGSTLFAALFLVFGWHPNLWQ